MAGNSDEGYMREALALAGQAAALGEVPVGAVVVWDGEIVGRGYNRRETEKNALAHAELEAIDEACRKLGGWRLWKATLYVTLEPCPMCAGAIVNARIARVVFGAADPKSGACGSVANLCALPGGYHPRVESGLLAGESSALLAEFFRGLRTENPAPPETAPWASLYGSGRRARNPRLANENPSALRSERSGSSRNRPVSFPEAGPRGGPEIRRGG